MKLLMLPRYARSGASSRVRMLQYWPALEAAGFDIEVQPLFDDDYLTRLYGTRGIGVSAGRAFLRRIRRLIAGNKADVVWLEKEALPWLPWLIEKRLLPDASRLVSDYDDAVFHRYDHHRSKLVRNVLGQKIGRVMACSAVVTAGNAYLAGHAVAAGAEKVEIVPTIVDADIYRPGRMSEAEKPVIGWIGTPGTWNEFVKPKLELFRETAQVQQARFLAVGVTDQHCTEKDIEYRPWSEKDEVALIQEMDIGLMPLEDTPWARGKCGYKLIQYMACGLPVIASPVGVNTEIVEHGVNGFLARTDSEWKEALTILLNDPDLRRRMGEAGRRKVEAEYSLQVWGPKVVSLLRSVVERPNP